MNEGIGPLLPHAPISPMARIRIERILPAPGEILVRTGERVGASQRIARIPARGEIRVINVARTLSLNDRDLSRVMVKKRGERVEAGEILAARRGGLPFLHKPCRAPIAGRLVAIAHGWVVIEAETPLRSPGALQRGSADGRGTEAETTDLLAFVAGQVTATTKHRSVTIETIGTHITGACGVGGEGSGVLQIPVKAPTHVLTADEIGLGFNNAILVGGAGVSPRALDRAREMKVKGIIVGGISASLYDLTPALPFPVVATEGYGKLPMSSAVFDTLKGLEGREVSISGHMGEVWDSTRPTIIVPLAEHQDGEGELGGTLPVEPAQVGDRVRAVRHPLLGQVGEIVSLLAEAQPVPSGLFVPGAQVAFAGSKHTSYRRDTVTMQAAQFVPWLNLECIG